MTEIQNSAELITQGNKAFYALTAAEYDKMGRGMVVEVSKQNAANILERVPGISSSKTDIMDFAAGTGLLAMFLAPRCRSVTAVDQSKEMIAQLESKLAQQTGEEKIDNIHPVVVDVLASQGDDSPLQGKQFDVITCTNSFHHFSDPVKVTQTLAKHLKPGGYFAVVDLTKTETSAQFHESPSTQKMEDGGHRQVEDNNQAHSHGHAHAHSQHQHHQDLKKHHHVIAWKGGFSQEDMESFFSAANLKLINMAKSTEFKKNGKTFDAFLAIAQKPSA